MAIVDELEVHVDEDRVEDERELVPIQVEGGVDETDEVVVGVLINCGVVVGLGYQRSEDYVLDSKIEVTHLVGVEHCRGRLLVVALTNAGLRLDLSRLLLDLRGLAAELAAEQSLDIP